MIKRYALLYILLTTYAVYCYPPNSEDLIDTHDTTNNLYSHYMFDSRFKRCESCIEANSEQLKLGNLALPSSQQPGPLFGFGQNVVDKGDFQFFADVMYLQGKAKCRKYNDFTPALLYAFNDHSSIFLAAPWTVQSTFDGEMNGIQNILVQFEFDLYVNAKIDATDETTFLIAGLSPQDRLAWIPQLDLVHQVHLLRGQ